MSEKRTSDFACDFAWVRLDVSLPCGMDGCDHTTNCALIERDPTFEGLWQLLPICDRCRAEWQESDAPARRRKHKDERAGVAPGTGK